jgi:tRNA(His) guanylyltransferase
MKFEQLDRRMRVYETAHDHCVLPGLHMVARIDGRSFSQLTRSPEHGLDAPYDTRFRDCMVATLLHLVTQSGFSVLFGYTQSDELSLLFRRDESAFGRKLRKLPLGARGGGQRGGSRSAFGAPGAFDCAHLASSPDDEDVVDYFRWRQEDAHRNALNGHCVLAPACGKGLDDHAATQQLRGVSLPARHELLHQHGIQFNTLPLWQRRGIGTYWESYTEAGTDPRTGATVESVRRRVKVDDHLLMRDDYDAFVRGLVAAASPDSHASASAGVSTAKPSPAG